MRGSLQLTEDLPVIVPIRKHLFDNIIFLKTLAQNYTIYIGSNARGARMAKWICR